MSNLKISQLTGGNPAQSGDTIPIERSVSGVPTNFSVTASSIAALGSGGAPTFNTAGQGFFWSTGHTGFPPLMTNNGLNSVIIHTANQVLVYQFTLLASYKISKVAWQNIVGANTDKVAFGIYDANGNKLLDTGAVALTGTGSPVPEAVTLSSPVTLGPGVYYFAQTTTNASATFLAYELATNSTFGGFEYLMTPTWFGNFPNPQTYGDGVTSIPLYGGIAANASVSGVLPSTLGTISAVPSGSGTGYGFIACVLFIV